MIDNQNLQLTEDQAFNMLEAEKLQKQVTENATKQAEIIAEKKVAERMAQIGDMFSGRKSEGYSWEKEGREKPRGWQEVEENIAKGNYVKQTIKETAREVLEENEKKKAEQTKQLSEDTRRRYENIKGQWDREFMDLHDTGRLGVKMSDEVREKLKRGEQLSKEEFEKEPAIVAYNKLLGIVREKGLSSLKEGFYEHFKLDPPGKTAPVFGSSSQSNFGRNDKDYTYDDVKKISRMIDRL